MAQVYNGLYHVFMNSNRVNPLDFRWLVLFYVWMLYRVFLIRLVLPHYYLVIESRYFNTTLSAKNLFSLKR